MTTRGGDASATTDCPGSAPGGDHAPGGATSGSGSGHEQLVQEGVDHLRRAARETIAAMRALLDLAEGLVDDPQAAEALVGAIGSFAQFAVHPGEQVNRARSAATASGAPQDDDGGRVQSIPVS